MTVNLGMPAPPPPVLAPRRPTRQIRVGKVLVGGELAHNDVRQGQRRAAAQAKAFQ